MKFLYQINVDYVYFTHSVKLAMSPGYPDDTDRRCMSLSLLVTSLSLFDSAWLFKTYG